MAILALQLTIKESKENFCGAYKGKLGHSAANVYTAAELDHSTISDAGVRSQVKHASQQIYNVMLFT